MHRFIITASIAIAASALAATASATGAYERRETASAEVCARACEDDRLCQAWVYADSACDLMAAAPSDMSVAPGASGYSSRAPQFLRDRNAVAAAPVSITPPYRQLAPTPLAIAGADADPNLNVEFALLGGPEPNALRQRLPN